MVVGLALFGWAVMDWRPPLAIVAFLIVGALLLTSANKLITLWEAWTQSSRREEPPTQ